MISRWKKKEDALFKKAAETNRLELLTKCRRNDKHKTLFRKLFEKFNDARSKELRVNFEWLYVRANKIHLELTPNADRLSKSTITYFLRRNKIRMLRVQKKRQTDVKKPIPEFMKWHGNLREKLVKSGSKKPTYDLPKDLI